MCLPWYPELWGVPDIRPNHGSVLSICPYLHIHRLATTGAATDGHMELGRERALLLFSLDHSAFTTAVLLLVVISAFSLAEPALPRLRDRAPGGSGHKTPFLYPSQNAFVQMC